MTVKYGLILNEIKNLCTKPKHNLVHRAAKEAHHLRLFEKPVKYINIKESYKQSTLALKRVPFYALTSNAFKDYRKLTKLYLTSAKIETLEADSFLGLKHLTYLKLVLHKKSNQINPNAFNGLNQLECLFIEFSAQNLENLDLHVCESLSHLKRIQFNNCLQKTSDTDWIKSKTKWQTLFTHVKRLTTFELFEASFHSIDDSFFSKINQLEILTLMHTRLNTVDINGLRGLSQLQECNISFNDLKTLNLQSFANLPQLKCLYLYFNQIKSLENTTNGSIIFNTFPNLEHLDIESNEIAELKPNVFRGMTRLQVLNVSANSLRFLEVNTFMPLIHLNKLDLSFNKLAEIKAVFGGLCELEVLSLSYNEISLIQPRSFDALTKLNRLHLEQNKLTRFDTSLLNKLNHLEVCNLSENQLEDDSKEMLMKLHENNAAPIAGRVKANSKRKRTLMFSI